MRHLNFLDGLRAISILMVLGFHGFGPISGKLPAGWLGVDIFFVISGFLITTILLREKIETGKINFRNFYVRRFLRLMPVYWVFLATVGTLFWTATPKMLVALGMAAGYMSDYDIALGWGNILGSGLELTWSLSIEEKFYFVWPAIVALLGLRSRYCAVVAIIACELFKAYLVTHHATVALPYRILGGFDCHIDELMFGCLGAQIMADQRNAVWLKRISNNVVSCAVLGVIAWIWSTTPYPTSVTNLTDQILYNTLRIPSITGLSAVFIVLCAVNESVLPARILSFAPLRFVGKLSYSIYLWHGLVVWELEKTGFGHRITHNIYKRELLNFVACFIASGASYYLIEMPFLRLKKRFEFKSTPPKAGDLSGQSVEQDAVAGQPNRVVARV